MLENIVYEILDLPYPKIDTEDFEDKIFKLNSTEKLIYLGEFKPYLIDKIIEQINIKRKNILLEIKKNSFDLGLGEEEISKLNYNISSLLIYKDFLQEFKESNYFKDDREFRSEKRKFRVNQEIQKSALNYAQNKIKLKEKKFELTPRDYDRFEEKYIKEYINIEQSNFNDEESERLQDKKSIFENFTNKYSADIKGYKKYISHTSIYEKLQNDFNFFIPSADTKRHTYISGMTGSGKSELIKLLIYSDILKRLKNQKISTVLIEPHGDLSEEVLKFTENYQNKDLIYLHPNLDSRYTMTINPFELKDEEKTERNIANNINRIAKKSNIFKTLISGNSVLTRLKELESSIVKFINNPK